MLELEIHKVFLGYRAFFRREIRRNPLLPDCAVLPEFVALEKIIFGRLRPAENYLNEVQIMKKMHQDVYIGIVVILVSLVGFLYGVFTVSGEAGVVPKALALIMLAFGVYITGDGMIKTHKQVECNYTMAWSQIKPCFITFGAVAAYAVAFFFIGYYVATFFFLTGLMYVLKAGSLKKIILIALCTDICLYVVFIKIFAVNMSRIGILF